MPRRSKRLTAPAIRAKPAARKAYRPKPLAKSSRAKAAGANRSRAKSSGEKVQAYRDRMRAKGFRLVQMWLPDTRSPEFAAQAHRASLAIANSPTEQDDQAFIDSVQWWTSEENTE